MTATRIGLLLSSMNEEEAGTLGIPVDDRLQYVRLDDAKANLSKRAGKARWFRLSDVTLDNAQPPYQRGDEVGVVGAWEPPNVWNGMQDANAILDRIAPQVQALRSSSNQSPQIDPARLERGLQEMERGEGIDAEEGRDLLDHVFDHSDPLRPAKAAHGRIRRAIGPADRTRHGDIGDEIRIVRMENRALHDRQREVGRATTVGIKVNGQRLDPAVRAEADTIV